MLNDTITSNYRETKVLIIFWSVNITVFFLMLFQHWMEKPKLMRLLHFVMIVRNILPWYNFGDRKTFDDVTQVMEFN